MLFRSAFFTTPDNVDVVMDADGNVVVVFDAIGLVHYTRYKPGTGWLADIQIGKLVGPLVDITSSNHATLGTNANGDVLVLWQRREAIEGTNEYHLFSSRYDKVADTWSDLGIAPKPYAAGSWGPAGAFALLERSGRAWLDE